MLAMTLLGSLPLFAQNATGTGMELLNLCMLVIVIVQAAHWMERPDERRLSAFVLGTVLLVQSRYESALYVLPAALLIVWGWWRAGRVVLAWPAVLSPWLLVPVALQQKIVSNSPVMWELHGNQTARFSLDYLKGNLEGFWGFFTLDGLFLANSPLLFWGGAVAALVVLVRLGLAWRRRQTFPPLAASLLLFGGGIVGITTLMMFYYWAAFNDPMASRFALPLSLLLIFCLVVALAWADRRWPASLVGLFAVGWFIVGVSAPKQSYHFYSHIGNDELDWEQRVVAGRGPGARLVVTNKSPLPWVVRSTPSILLTRARAVADRLADQMKLPDFQEILVTQSARPTTVDGDYQLVPDDTLPEWFHLELLAERRFGTKLARISRLVAIDLPGDFKASVPQPVGNEAARSSPSAQ
jgi:hypothetical protein